MIIENSHVSEQIAEYFCDDIELIESIISYFLQKITVLRYLEF